MSRPAALFLMVAGCAIGAATVPDPIRIPVFGMFGLFLIIHLFLRTMFGWGKGAAYYTTQIRQSEFFEPIELILRNFDPPPPPIYGLPGRMVQSDDRSFLEMCERRQETGTVDPNADRLLWLRRLQLGLNGVDRVMTRPDGSWEEYLPHYYPNTEFDDNGECYPYDHWRHKGYGPCRMDPEFERNFVLIRDPITDPETLLGHGNVPAPMQIPGILYTPRTELPAIERLPSPESLAEARARALAHRPYIRVRGWKVLVAEELRDQLQAS